MSDNTYAAAGVSIEEGDRAVELFAPHAKRATRPEVLGGLGGFAGLALSMAVIMFSFGGLEMLGRNGLVDVHGGVEGARQGHVLDDRHVVVPGHLPDAQRQRIDALRHADGRAVALVRLQADDKGVDLAAVLSAEPLRVRADARALKQMALNLLSNAVKFTARGGVTVEWDVAGERVTPAAIRGTALLTIEGELDDISGSGQTEAAHGLCTSIPAQDRRHFEVQGAGHYGIFSGRRWRTIIYPQLRDFILEHNKAPKVAKEKVEA